MTDEEHKQRHIELHRAFDELLADWLGQVEGASIHDEIYKLMEWSHGQTNQPTGR